MRSFEKLRKRAAISPAAACRFCVLAYKFESEVLHPAPQFVLLVLRGLLARAYPQVEHRAAHCNSGRRCAIVAPALLVRLGASPLPADRMHQSRAAISLPLRGVIRGYFAAFCGDSFVCSRCGKPEEIPLTSPGGPNGIRTRVSALRGPCPRPLDDGATSVRRKRLAGRGGLEPPLRGPEPRVLPLDDLPSPERSVWLALRAVKNWAILQTIPERLTICRRAPIVGASSP